MAFEKITENVENISLLADTPAMTSTELKAEFDKGNKTIKTKFNKLVDDLNAFITTLATKEDVGGTVLYNTSEGQNNDITLNDSLENFDRVKIFYYSGTTGDRVYNSVEVENPNGKKVEITSALGWQNGRMLRIETSIYNLSNTSITLSSGTFANLFDKTINAEGANGSTRIYKVVGYKD